MSAGFDSGIGIDKMQECRKVLEGKLGAST
jgi:hypothetical protein